MRGTARIETAAAALAAAALLIPATAATAAGSGENLLVSRPSGLATPPFGIAGPSSAGRDRSSSGDGRFVVFTSDSDGLVAGGTSRHRQVFVRDLLQNTTRLISRTPAGRPGNGPSGEPAVSLDGRWVAFSSEAPDLAPQDGAPPHSVYVADRLTGVVRLAGRADGASGAPGNGDEFDPAVAVATLEGGDLLVAFTSYSTNLGADPRPGEPDVFIRNVTDGTTVPAAVLTGAAPQSFGPSSQPSLAGNGTRIAFVASGPVPGRGGEADRDYVVVRGLNADFLRIASAASDGTLADGHSAAPSLNGDGSKVAFLSGAANLDQADGDSNDDVFLWEQVAGGGHVTRLVSRRDDDTRIGGGQFSGPAMMPTITGTTVGFATRTDGATPEDANGQSDVLVRILDPLGPGGSTRLASRRSGDGAGGDGASVAPTLAGSANDAPVVVFQSNATNFSDLDEDGVTQVYRREANETRLASLPDGPDRRFGDGLRHASTGPGSLDATGRRVAFRTEAVGLDPAFPAASGLYVRDVVTGATELASRPASGSPGRATVHDWRLSADGRHVAFLSPDPLFPGDDASSTDLFVRDLELGTTTLLGRDPAQAPGFVSDPAITADGSKVAFSTTRSLVAADANTAADVYVQDVRTRAASLASFSSLREAANAAISADGRRVAFVSPDRPGGPPTGDDGNVWVRDTATGAVENATRPTAGVDPGSYFANGVALDADGGAVAFRTGARLLGTDLDDERDVYVRDLATQALTLVSAPGDGFGSTARPSNPDLSADGRRVAFTATTPTTADDEDWPAAVFVHDLDSGRNEPASTGLGGAPANRQMRDPALSGDGRCVAFDSDATNLVDVSLSGDFERVYLHALRGGACPTGPGTDTPAATPIAPGGSGVVPPLASILAARLTRTRFAVGVARTLLSSRRRARRGTTVLFSLAAPGMLRMTVERRLAGRRSGRRCVAPTRRTRRRRPCTRILAAGPAIKRPGLAAGPGRLAFSGRLGRRALRPGRYQARLVGVNAAGAISDPRVLRFTIVRR